MNETKKTADIGCLEAIESLYAWLDNELDDTEMTTSLEDHLSHCESCWSRAEMEKSLTEHIKRSGQGNSVRTPRSLQNRLDKLMKKL